MQYTNIAEYVGIFPKVSESEPGLLIPNIPNISEYFRISVQCLFVVRSVRWSVHQLLAPFIQSQGDTFCSWQQPPGQGHIFVALQ